MQNLIKHLGRMLDGRIPKHVPKYKLKGIETEEGLGVDGMSCEVRTGLIAYIMKGRKRHNCHKLLYSEHN